MGLPYGVSFVGTVLAWDTSANAYKTGDSANISTSWVKDGTRSATTNGNAETDATNCPGQYKVTLTATEAQCLTGELCGKSTTANVVIIPLAYTFVRVPNVDAGTTNGLFIAGTNAATAISTSLTINGTAMVSQTGDSFARLGAPAGASIAADIAEIEVETDDIAAIKTKTDFLPSATAGAAGGVFIAGTNAATTITTALTTTFTGNLTGSVGSVTGLTASNLDATVSSRMATYTQPTGFLAATFPSGTVANTTNITAGTITTVTNLTNAPTAGDFTATMKTSIGTAVLASNVAGITGVTFPATVASPTNITAATGCVLSATGSAALTESYAADGATATLPQLLYLTVALLSEFSISGVTLTAKKLDGSTTAGTFTLNDATTPTAITRAT